MAAPTQEYPPWLTPVPTVIFDGNGAPIATSTTILFLPLTYYGPSIPLGPDWTYGGLTSPASSTAPPSTTSEMSITTSTAIPTSLPSTFTSITSTAIPSSSLSFSLSLSTSFNPPTSSASSTPTGSTSHMFSRVQLIGIIVGSILGFLGLFIGVLIAYLYAKRRRHRTNSPDFGPVTSRLNGLNGGYQMVGAAGRSTWAEGSPRHSGEEADPFLNRNAASTSTQPPDREMGVRRGSVPPYVGITRVPVPDLGTQSSAGSSSNGSGYGTVVDRPTLNLLPDTERELDRQRRGPILSPKQLQHVDEDSEISQNAPLVPPRLVGPDPAPMPHPHLTSKSSQVSLSADADAEPATLLTARRVRAEDLTSRSPPRLNQPLGGEGTSGRNSGLWASLGLDRISWLANSRRNSRPNSRPNSLHPSAFGDDDPEIGRALLGPPEMSELPPPRRVGLGLGFDGERPISNVSAQSGNTVYHDAYASQPGTPVTPFPPPPRALAPSSSDMRSSGGAGGSTTTISRGDPTGPPPDQTHSYATSATNNTNLSRLPPSYDILDSPVPAPVSHFTSTSSLRQTDTGSSLGTGTPTLPFPPGLGIAPHKSWTDDSSAATHINGSLNSSLPALSNQASITGIMIDLLEEAPPASLDGWRSLSGQHGIVAGRRTTFGQFIAPDVVSEEGSVHTHLSPTYSRSTGSAPSSTRRDLSGSTGSASSRPSVLSAVRTHSSGHSLAHSKSVSSDARRRGSPAMSAFGSAGGRSRSPPASTAILNTPPAAHFVPERAGVHRMGPSSIDSDELSNGRMSPTSPLLQLSHAPWAGGLDNNWTPT